MRNLFLIFFIVIAQPGFSQQLWHGKERTVRYQPEGNEQDYYVDGFAFTTDAPRPVRISLKRGKEITKDYKYTSIRGFSNFGIDGGAATVLDLPLDEKKQLKNLVLKTIANDVVIGLMSLTLIR